MPFPLLPHLISIFPLPPIFPQMALLEEEEKARLLRTRCVQLLCQSNTPKHFLDDMEKCRRANGDTPHPPRPPSLLVINHAWQHRISYFYRHRYWHSTYCHSSPPRNYKKLQKKKKITTSLPCNLRTDIRESAFQCSDIVAFQEDFTKLIAPHLLTRLILYSRQNKVLSHEKIQSLRGKGEEIYFFFYFWLFANPELIPAESSTFKSQCFSHFCIRAAAAVYCLSSFLCRDLF